MSKEEINTQVMIIAITSRIRRKLAVMEASPPLLNFPPFNLLHKSRIRGAKIIMGEITR